MAKLLVIVVIAFIATRFIKPGWLIGTFGGLAECLLFTLPWWKTAIFAAVVLGIMLMCLKLEEKNDK